MTDNEIIKAIEAYSERQCSKCNVRDLGIYCNSCFINVVKQAPRIINRLNAELESMRTAGRS